MVCADMLALVAPSPNTSGLRYLP